MTSSAPSSTGYRCPLCGDPSAVQEVCGRCSVQMVPTDGSIRATSRNRVAAWPLRGGGWILAFAILAFYGSIFIGTGLPGPEQLAMLCTMLAGSIFVPALWGAIGLWLRARRSRELREVLERFPEDVPAREIRDVGEGRARIHGRVALVNTALSVKGARCVALTRQRSNGTEQFASVVDFRVLDDQGHEALVHTGSIIVTDGERFGDTVAIPEGASVEIVGTVRHVPRLPDGSEGFRVMSHAVEIGGTAEEPVVIRIVRDASANAAPAPVRVALDAGAVVPNDGEETLTEGAAIQANERSVANGSR